MADTFLNNHIKEQEEVREKAGIEIQRQQRQYQIVTAKIEAETSNALQAIEFSSSAQIETINLSTARSKLRTQKLADENEKKAKLEAAQALITVENNQAKISGAIVQYQEQTRTLQENANSARVVTINEENEKRRILQEQTDDEIRKIRERGKQEIASINEISHKRIKKLRRKGTKRGQGKNKTGINCLNNTNNSRFESSQKRVHQDSHLNPNPNVNSNYCDPGIVTNEASNPCRNSVSNNNEEYGCCFAQQQENDEHEINFHSASSENYGSFSTHNFTSMSKDEKLCWCLAWITWTDSRQPENLEPNHTTVVPITNQPIRRTI